MAPRRKTDAPVVVIFPGTPAPRRKRAQSPTTKLKRKIAKATGIPTTSAGRKRKAERMVCDFLGNAIDKLAGK